MLTGCTEVAKGGNDSLQVSAEDTLGRPEQECTRRAPHHLHSSLGSLASAHSGLLT